MKKCLALSLMVIAIALVQVPVSNANAPVVSDPGDVIVGDLENATNPATGTNIFVYPDAIDLDKIANDDATPDGDIKWSFLESTDTYTINGVESLSSSLSGLNQDDPTSPRASSRIDLNDSDPGDPISGKDGNARTITFRNVAITPDNIPVDPGAFTGIIDVANPGTVGDQTRMLTLFASDCTSYSSRTITVYTANNTSDALSGGGFTLVYAPPPFGPGAQDGWIGGAVGGFGGSVAVNASGLCMTVALTGLNHVLWVSPENYWQLTANTVYVIRITASTDGGANADTHAPFFFTYDSFHAATGSDTYGGQVFTQDIEGGNFAISRSNGWTSSDYMMAPLAGNTPQFIAGAFTAATDDDNDPRIRVELIDTNPNLGVGGNDADFGTVCVSSVQISSILRDNLQTVVEYNAPLDPSTHFGESNAEVAGGFGAATVSFVGGEYLISLDGATTPENVTRTVGTFNASQADPGNGNNIALHPVVLMANAIYRGSAVIRMVSSETDPPDNFQIALSDPNFETGSFHYTHVSVGDMFQVGSPRLASSTYEAYHAAVNVSASITPNSIRIKTDLKVFAVDFIAGTGNGAGQVAVSTLEIERVTNVTANQ